MSRGVYNFDYFQPEPWPLSCIDIQLHDILFKFVIIMWNSMLDNFSFTCHVVNVLKNHINFGVLKKKIEGKKKT